MLTFTPEQTQVANAFLNDLRRGRMASLTGLAGTGKTTTMRHVVDTLRSEGRSVRLSAPTHKAARVLSEKTGQTAGTVHSALALVPLPDNKGDRVLTAVAEPRVYPGDILCVDEASMLSPKMMERLTELDDVTVALIGDPGQVPPVGYTHAVFLDYTQHDHALHTIMRQASDSPVPLEAARWRGAQRVRWRREPVIGASGGVLYPERREAKQEFIDKAVAHARSGASSDTAPVWLAYTNKAVIGMASQVRVALHGYEQATSHPFLPGDQMVVCSPVIVGQEIVLPVSANVTVQTSTPAPLTVLGEQWMAYMVRGLIDGSDQHPIEIAAMAPMERRALLDVARNHAETVKTASAWQDYYALEDQLCDLRPIYSSTVHRSQGSTYPDVYIDAVDLDNSNAASIRNQLIYTALTRTSGFVRVVG